MLDQNGFLYVLSITSPIFILILIGYGAVRYGILQKEGMRTLGAFVVNFGLPAAIFKALSERSFQDILHLDYLLTYGLGSLLAFSLILMYAKVYRRKSLTESAMFGMGSSFSNSLMVGYPIIFQLFGPAALVPFALTLIVENFFLMPLALALADTGGKKDERFVKALLQSLPQLLKNPIIIAIALGVLCSLLSIQLPPVVTKVVDMFAVTVGGVALFTIGGILVGIKVRGMMQDIGILVAAKLILHPACIFLMMLLMPPMDPVFQGVALVLACMPMFSIFAVIGQRYNMGSLCAAVLLPATLFSFLTINIMVWLLSLPG
ncbi:AEC family transporter [Oceanospirillum beijerinckii]|uniref:AEC family transporter n=1 Tax=Oceanospirillum beijerinckii TaxID=64976 RepID=UPI00040DB770|nr:AEC family transporter [Oceanospirillum beijerinckii]MAC45780.1 AEC family transporter [Oceanospirillum sp.]